MYGVGEGYRSDLSCGLKDLPVTELVAVENVDVVVSVTVPAAVVKDTVAVDKVSNDPRSGGSERE